MYDNHYIILWHQCFTINRNKKMINHTKSAVKRILFRSFLSFSIDPVCFYLQSLYFCASWEVNTPSVGLSFSLEQYFFLLKDTGLNTTIRRIFRDVMTEKTPFANSFMPLNQYAIFHRGLLVLQNELSKSTLIWTLNIYLVSI